MVVDDSAEQSVEVDISNIFLYLISIVNSSPMTAAVTATGMSRRSQILLLSLVEFRRKASTNAMK